MTPREVSRKNASSPSGSAMSADRDAELKVAQAFLPGEPLGARARRREARPPGVRALEEVPPRLGQPPRQRRVDSPPDR